MLGTMFCWNLSILLVVVAARNASAHATTVLIDGDAAHRVNKRPIIAVMSQELSKSLEEIYGNDTYSSYISASYVKFIESAGARVVPVLIDQPDEYYEMIFRKTNGLVLPGGSANIQDSGYSRGAKKIFKMALEAFDNGGDYYPIWGTCLGFELLALLTNDDIPNLTSCHSYDVALKLNVTHGFYASRMFVKMPMGVAKVLTTENVTVNFHHWCLTPETFNNSTNPSLRDFWTVMATNMDDDGIEFVSMFESKNYPIWGVQFHPEKNAYEWTTSYDNIPHSKNAVGSAFFFADFFVDECRKSGHRFANGTEESHYLIYNYSPAYTGSPEANWIMEQSYLFH